jgi:RNA polymerase sporulation-specific sigma factor
MTTDNLALLERISHGDEGAIDDLVKNNMNLVRSIAFRFKDRGCETEDLVQIGSIGLIKAGRSFDISYGCAFSTYAVPLIVGEIKRFLRDDGLIKVSRSIKSLGLKILREKQKFNDQYGREPTATELSKLCNLSQSEMIMAYESVCPVRSLSETVNSEDDCTLETFIYDPENPIEALTDRIALKEAIASLPQMQQKIIKLRYYHNLSQHKTGEILGMTQVKISREEKKILESLKKLLY